MAGIDGRLVANQMAQHHVTTVTASPPLIDRVAPYLKQNHPAVLLRRILTGGAPVTDSQLENWQQSYPDTQIVVAYGSTEAEPVGHILAQQRLALNQTGKGFCTGRPSNLVQTQVIPITQGPIDLTQTGLEELFLSVGEIGELIVAGDHVCRDYFQNETATRENKLFDASGQLWHRMGDTGYFDDEGRFWLVGRVHSSILRDGQWFHPQLVEQIVRTVIPEQTQVAAIGCHNQQVGNHVVVIVALNQNDMPQHEDSRLVLQNQIKTVLEQYDLPCDCIHLTTTPLPLDPRHQSKIDYAQTQTMYQTGRFGE